MIPEGVERLDYRQFINCTSLATAVLPESLNYIGDAVFGSCALTSLNIPGGVAKIGSNFVNGCGELSYINVSEKNANYLSSEGILFTKDMKKLIRCPAGTKLTDYSIPESVLSLEFSAFENCKSLRSVIIPSGVSWLESGTFRNCTSLESLTIPRNINRIGGDFISGCSVLTSVVFENAYGWSYQYYDVDLGQSVTMDISPTCLTEPVGAKNYLMNMRNNYYGGTWYRN